LWSGGDGTAERRYLETAALAVRQITRLTDFAIDRTAWDLLLTYLPFPDEALHQWLGYLDTSLPGQDPAVAARLRPFLDDALGLVDNFVGHLAEHAGNGAILAIASDHGLVGANCAVRPNVVLARAGLLATNAAGQVDLARTRAVYFPGNTGYVLVSRVARKGGIVRPEDEEAVRREATAALLGLRDPATGRPVITGVFDARTGAGLGLGLLADGDLFVTFAPGYAPLPDLAGEPVEAGPPKGVHFQETDRPEMRAALTLSGPGVAVGTDLGLLKLIDVAPTLCALMGLDPPAQAAGTVVEAALARRPTAAPARP
jgi:predicted AlkP superfamily phosphohydrolase/phosphomutase